jgi:TIGR03009 family protein
VRTLIAWTVTVAVGALTASTASAQQGTTPSTKRTAPPAASKAAQPPAAPVDNAAERARLEADFIKARGEMEQVLAEWEKRSKLIGSLDVIFDRIDRSVGWGDQYYQGRAMLQSPDLACLQFQRYKLDPKEPKGKPLFLPGKDGKLVAQLEAEPYERIVCTGAEVIQYSWDVRKMIVYPLDEESRQKALQQGPLPFLFNMKASEAKKRYTMTLRKQDEKDYLIEITPNEEIDKKSFSRAFLWLSKTTFLPNQLWLYTIGEKERQEFRFAGGYNTIVANKPLDKNFFLKKTYGGWTVINNPGADDAPGDPTKAVGQAVKKPQNPSATKPATRPR